MTGAPASSYELALTDPDFKFPQVWRSNLAVDQRLPWDLIGTARVHLQPDVNGISYINANLPAAQTSFVGADTRPRWTSNRINANVTDAIVLGNQNDGLLLARLGGAPEAVPAGLPQGRLQLRRVEEHVDPGSIASGSWTGNPISGDPNNPPVANSNQFPGNRVFLAGSYRLEYLKFGATTFSFFWQGYNNGVSNYTYAGDLNGDGATANDLIYIPRDQSEMNFTPITRARSRTPRPSRPRPGTPTSARTPTSASTAGQYAERYGVRLPMVFRLDFSVAQDLFKNLGGARHSLQFRADFLNFSNLLNHDWGVGQRLVNAPAPHQPGGRRSGPGDVPAARGQQPAHDQVLGDDGVLRRTSTRSSSACGTPSTRPAAAGLPRAGRGDPARPFVWEPCPASVAGPSHGRRRRSVARPRGPWPPVKHAKSRIFCRLRPR